MTIPELEVMFREQIDYFINCGPARRDRDCYYNQSMSRLIILTFRTPKDDGDAEVQLTYNYHTRRIIFDVSVRYDLMKNKSAYWVSNIPESEEEYFQESTVKDMYFTWEFYQYLERVFQKVSQ
ncbi:hypothetical protein AAGG91_002672 [Salmonella enterica]|nr:hypothetical protein [Salmonella enterica]